MAFFAFCHFLFFIWGKSIVVFVIVFIFYIYFFVGILCFDEGVWRLMGLAYW
jgi:hypothetical protein